jgi:hypothetical protein
MFQPPNHFQSGNEGNCLSIGHAFTPDGLNAGDDAERPNAFALLIGGFACFAFELML